VLTLPSTLFRLGLGAQHAAASPQEPFLETGDTIGDAIVALLACREDSCSGKCTIGREEERRRIPSGALAVRRGATWGDIIAWGAMNGEGCEDCDWRCSCCCMLLALAVTRSAWFCCCSFWFFCCASRPILTASSRSRRAYSRCRIAMSRC